MSTRSLRDRVGNGTPQVREPTPRPSLGDEPSRPSPQRGVNHQEDTRVPPVLSQIISRRRCGRPVPDRRLPAAPEAFKMDASDPVTLGGAVKIAKQCDL